MPKRHFIIVLISLFALSLPFTLFLSAQTTLPLKQSALSTDASTSQPAHLLKDIRTTAQYTNASSPADFLTVGDTIYFTAYAESSGGAIMKSDAAFEEITVLKGDLQGYFVSPFSAHLTDVNGTIFFSFNDGSTGSELWKSDGTVEGTELVANINKTAFDPYDTFPTGGSHPNDHTNMNGVLFFTANDAVYGRELWRSDGTVTGTVLVKNINPLPLDPDDSSQGHAKPQSLVVINDTLYFLADDGTNGQELWKSDGTEAGTVLVKDINPTGGALSSYSFKLVEMNGMLYFQATDGASGYELWQSDGSESGTMRVADINNGGDSSNPSQLTVIDQTLFFVADDGANGNELWKSDGTVLGTLMVKNIDANSTSSISISSQNLTAYNNELYFAAEGSSSVGRELWKSDGTEAGTVLVKDIWSGSQDSSPAKFLDVNNILYFVARDNDYGQELWRTDGSNAGTILVKDIAEGSSSSSPTQLSESNGRLLFSAFSSGIGTEPWISDGTEAGTTLIANIGDNTSSSSIGGFVSFNDQLFFPAQEETYGSELWVTDATVTGTQLFQDIYSGEDSAYPGNLTVMGDSLYFSANHPTYQMRLWRTDGTVNSTTIISTSGTSPSSFFPLNGTLFFRANDPSTGIELWKSDGTLTGTTIVKDINPGTGPSSPGGFIEFNGLLYFTANNSVWKSDGTEAGTQLLDDMDPATRSSSSVLSVSGNQFFFTAIDDQINRGLWRSDGTEEGTIRLHEVFTNTNQFLTFPYQLQPYADGLIFAADDGIHGKELWISDGTVSGTVMVADLWAGVEGSHPHNFVQYDGRIFFIANDGEHGYELWETDGTENGTKLLYDFYLGETGSTIFSELTVVDDLLFFTALSNPDGFEPWVSDGTITGTRQIQDIYPGAGSSSPRNFAGIDNSVVFYAHDSVHDSEPWAMSTLADLTVAYEMDTNPVGQNTPFTFTTVVTNTGIHVVPTATLSLTLPADLTVIEITSDTGQCEQIDTAVTCIFSDTYLGDRHEVLFEATTQDFIGSLNISAAVSGNYSEINLLNNEANLTIDISEIKLFLPVILKP